MSAHFAKDQVSFVPTSSFSAGAPGAYAPTSENAVLGALRGIAGWFTNGVKRRAVVNELSMLSDHELADIGLTRSDIPNVFDNAFAASRNCLRG